MLWKLACIAFNTIVLGYVTAVWQICIDSLIMFYKAIDDAEHPLESKTYVASFCKSKISAKHFGRHNSFTGFELSCIAYLSAITYKVFSADYRWYICAISAIVSFALFFIVLVIVGKLNNVNKIESETTRILHYMKNYSEQTERENEDEWKGALFFSEKVEQKMIRYSTFGWTVFIIMIIESAGWF